ncbi:zinc ribbon domain-containing protein [Natrinema sp. 1APR25-10V2]|uniref:DUF7577 domain-containing protein n=1 Tax=Natrinema sp. 1APR25-10V2 TaxID=2951081 RepID=UPI0028741F5B|nr:zinc ribbon domain-containing protein [Natrinema sp. 1APR25-10V2]MDS0473541.1 zinc ribbon domain-containing protein [Natrinema sp. 1APR25-10V2]
MVSPGQIYAAVVIGLLLAALGVCLPVLGGIFRDGLERRRDRRLEANDPDPGDETGVRTSTPRPEEDTAEGSTLTCRQCGAPNDPAFTYCWRCVELI